MRVLALTRALSRSAHGTPCRETELWQNKLDICNSNIFPCIIRNSSNMLSSWYVELILTPTFLIWTYSQWLDTHVSFVADRLMAFITQLVGVGPSDQSCVHMFFGWVNDTLTSLKIRKAAMTPTNNSWLLPPWRNHMHAFQSLHGQRPEQKDKTLHYSSLGRTLVLAIWHR